MKRPNPLKLVALGIAAILSHFAWAQTTDIWTSPSSSLWSTPGNWSAGVPTNTSIATFNKTSGLETSFNLIPSSTAYSLVFLGTGSANAYTFDTAGNENANTLTLASGITN